MLVLGLAVPNPDPKPNDVDDPAGAGGDENVAVLE